MTRLAALGLVVLGLCAAPAVAADPWVGLHRGLHLPRVAPGAACPVSPVDASMNWKAARIFGGSGTGKGPVYPGLGFTKGRLNVTRDEQFGGPWLGAKVLWYTTQAYRGRVLIRGARIDGPQPLGFNGEKTPDPELRIELGDTVEWAGQPARSRGVPSSVRVRTAGCYAVQIDGAGFSRVVVFAVAKR